MFPSKNEAVFYSYSSYSSQITGIHKEEMCISLKVINKSNFVSLINANSLNVKRRIISIMERVKLINIC